MENWCSSHLAILWTYQTESCFIHVSFDSSCWWRPQFCEFLASIRYYFSYFVINIKYLLPKKKHTNTLTRAEEGLKASYTCRWNLICLLLMDLHLFPTFALLFLFLFFLCICGTMVAVVVVVILKVESKQFQMSVQLYGYNLTGFTPKLGHYDDAYRGMLPKVYW